MKKFKVIAANGFHFGDKRLDRGTVFEAESKNAHIATALHFKQIAEIAPPTKPEKPEPPTPKPEKSEPSNLK
jgi:hypothetical protein